MQDFNRLAGAERSKRMNKIRRIVVGSLLGVASVGMASASSIIGYTSNTVTGLTELTYVLNLQKFDSTLGTLTGVQLYLRGSETTSFSFHNTSNGSVTFDAGATVDLGGSAGNSAVSSDKFNFQEIQIFDTGIGSRFEPGSCAAGGSPGPGGCTQITVAGGGTNAYGPYTVSNADAAYHYTTGTGFNGLVGVTKAGSSLANYAQLGGGTFTLSGATLNGITLIGAGGNIGVTQSANATFQAEVDYTYTVNSATPEPVSMALVGGGLVFCGLLRRRFKR